LTGVVPASLCQQDDDDDYYYYHHHNLYLLHFQNNQLQCYPECLLSSSVRSLNAGSTPICASEQPTAEPTAQPIDMGE